MGRVNKERLLAAKRRRQRLITTWSFIILSLLALSFVLYGLLPKADSRINIAKCITAHGATMYGSDESEEVQLQKRRFGPAFKEIKYINCAYSTDCREKNITVVPAWVLKNGARLEGAQTLRMLAKKTGCPAEE